MFVKRKWLLAATIDPTKTLQYRSFFHVCKTKMAYTVVSCATSAVGGSTPTETTKHIHCLRTTSYMMIDSCTEKYKMALRVHCSSFFHVACLLACLDEGRVYLPFSRIEVAFLLVSVPLLHEHHFRRVRRYYDTLTV
jgi:hypothetical protein